MKKVWIVIALLVAACSSVTVVTNTGKGASVNHDADKGAVIIKPRKTEEVK